MAVRDLGVVAERPGLLIEPVRALEYEARNSSREDSRGGQCPPLRAHRRYFLPTVAVKTLD